MAYFARQKRQSRFYWAELGFIALGLLGLQPSLFTNLIMGSQSRLISNADGLYPTPQSQTFRGYEYSPSPQFASYLPAYLGVAASPVNGWQQPASSPYPYSQQTIYTQPLTYGTTQAYGITQPYVAAATPLYPQQNYLQQGYVQPLLATNNASPNSFAQQQFYAAQPSPYLQPDFQPARPSSSTYSSSGQYSANNLAQANNIYGSAGYGASGSMLPTAVSSNNWAASQAGLYAGNTNYYTSPTGNSLAKPNQNYASNLHDATAPKLTQNQWFDSGMNSYNTGSTSARNYLNQPNAGYNSAPSYRSPSPLYR